VLVCRVPGSKNPTRLWLGDYGALTLEKARHKAREWRDLIKQGKDPRDVEARQREAEIKAASNTFAAVAGDFIRGKLPNERKGREVERDIRRDFIPALGERPITQITDIDIVSIIKAKTIGAPKGAQARNLLGIANRLFAWAKAQRIYGLTANPCADLHPKSLIGTKRKRNRILSDDEIFACWRSTKRLGYPAAPVYRLLMLTGLRLNEAADASWSEFDLRNQVWVIPEARMKAKNEEAREHAVPLTKDLLKILDDLPRFNGGDYLFSTTSGAKPAWISSKIKKRLDRRMLRTLRALARKRGDDPKKVQLPAWVNHDVRRTVRTRLSRLNISEEVREAILAHVRPGIKSVYDHYQYLPEKRDALERWAIKLGEIVAPPSEASNVVALRA
jgi:integrase